jgi:hypothetical protein
MKGLVQCPDCKGSGFIMQFSSVHKLIKVKCRRTKVHEQSHTAQQSPR